MYRTEKGILNIRSWDLKQIHSIVFSGSGFQGRWRDLNVTVGRHIPPAWYHIDDFNARIGARNLRNNKH